MRRPGPLRHVNAPPNSPPGWGSVPPATRNERNAHLRTGTNQEWNDSRAQALDVQLKPVVRLLEAAVQGELVRAVRQQKPLRARGFEGRHGLVG
jgi:hypothetical protein